MNKRIFLLLAVLLLYVLVTACGSGDGSGSSGVTAQASTSTATTDLSAVARLAVGTLKLEGTDQTVTASQAAELLTLWQAYQSLSTNDTTAQVELDALVRQIRGSMTAEQIQTMDTIQITSQTMAEVMQSAGAGVVASSSTPSASKVSQASALGGPGGPMDGGAPSDGGAMMSDPSMGGGAQATPDAAGQSVALSADISPMLLQAVIQLLETKIRAAG